MSDFNKYMSKRFEEIIKKKPSALSNEDQLWLCFNTEARNKYEQKYKTNLKLCKRKRNM